MYELHRSNRFKKSYKRICRSGFFDLECYKQIVLLLMDNQNLPDRFHDHALKGNYFGLRECHIKGDCLLVYEIDDKNKLLYLVEIGKHANIFE